MSAGGEGEGGGGRGNGRGDGRGRGNRRRRNGKYDGDSGKRRVREQSKQSRRRDGNQKERSFKDEEIRLREFRTRGPAASLVGISKYIEATSRRERPAKSERDSREAKSTAESEPVSREAQPKEEGKSIEKDDLGAREECDGAATEGKVSPDRTKAQADQQRGSESDPGKSNGSDGSGFGQQCPKGSVHARLGPSDPSGSRTSKKSGGG